ncbi:MAG: hypothetical protein QOJ13_3397 [Gaiellales bacterium]|jgi:hypothetical protein|nr:hypothetical protein [Gaiellales bacterium]
MRDQRYRDLGGWLDSYLDADPSTVRLLVDEVEDASQWIESGGPWADDDQLQRFLWARAHNACRGRMMDVKTIEIRHAILDLQDEYMRMTVRQIFYALTVRGVVPKTEGGGYVPVQRQVLTLRKQGALPWSFISDVTRWVRRPKTYDSVKDALVETARGYRGRLWRDQHVRCEVWLEKDALAGVIVDTSEAWDVPLMVSRGQSSETYCYAAAQAAKRAWEEAGLATIIYALYDRDKSGKVAAGKIEEKLRRYSDDAPISFTLLAVTDEQIQEWNLPTRPAKEKDEPDAVELDSIPPERLTELVESAIVENIDGKAWEIAQAYEQSEREIFMRMAANYNGEA